MKKIYCEMWKLAKPYYERGRQMDIDHIKWMMKDALIVCQKENIDESILIPLVILHDIGYAEVPKDNPFNLSLRKAHMKAGAKVAKDILEKLNYPKNKTEKIIYFISVHDSWALSDNSVYVDPILAVFNDLDYMWTATPKGFPAAMKILSNTEKEMIEWLENNDKLQLRPFSTKTTKKLYFRYLQNRIKEANSKINNSTALLSKLQL